MKVPPKFNYQKTNEELEAILAWFESNEEVDVDTALANYDRADELLKQLEAYLKNAKAKISLKIENSKQG